MSWTYGCPKCKNVLNPDETIILIVARDEMQVLVGFHPQPGNYTYYLPPGVELTPGRRYEFYCPLCRQNLAAAGHVHLSELELWQGELRRQVLFSNIAGERATYVVSEETVQDSHGDHVDTYKGEFK